MSKGINCCRICLSKNYRGQSIFNSYKGLFLPDVIQNISGVLVAKDDGLTDEICFKCTRSLVEAHNIRKKSIRSNKILKKRLGLVHTVEDLPNDLPHKTSEVNKLPEDNRLEDLLNENKVNVKRYKHFNKKRNSSLQPEWEVEKQVNIESTNNDHDSEQDIVEDDPSQTVTAPDVQCKYCHKTFYKKIYLTRHEYYHKIKKTKCPICSREFTHKSNLKRHFSVHKERNELACDKCGETFTESQHLYDHIKIHDETGSDEKLKYILECENCNDYKTESLSSYLTHMKDEHHIEIQKPFKCKTCGLQFASKQGMLRHIDNIHEDNRRNLRKRDKKFLCNTCGKKFHTNFHLEVHVRSHTGERPFKCKYCEKSFAQFSGLKMHTFTHTGEKPFDCKVCGKRFNQYGHVREHLLTHTNEKPHVCQICHHSFRVKGNLTAHMVVHTGKKPYNCDICNREFMQQTKLKAHLEKCHAIRNLEIEVGNSNSSCVIIRNV